MKTPEVLSSLFLATMVCVASPVFAYSRLVSVNIVCDEILDELLQEPKVRKKWLAASTLAKSPIYSNVASALKVPTIETDIEKVAKLKPDWVCASVFNQPDFISQLPKIGAKIEMVGSLRSIADIDRFIEQLGESLSLADQAKKLRSQLQVDVESVKKATKAIPNKPRILVYSSNGVMPGAKTLINEVIELAGGINVTANLGSGEWSKLSSEQLASLRPDLIISPSSLGDLKTIRSHLQSDVASRNWRASRKGHIYILEDRQLFASSHYVAETLANIQGIILSHLNSVAP